MLDELFNSTHRHAIQFGSVLNMNVLLYTLIYYPLVKLIPSVCLSGEMYGVCVCVCVCVCACADLALEKEASEPRNTVPWW